MVLIKGDEDSEKESLCQQVQNHKRIIQEMNVEIRELCIIDDQQDIELCQYYREKREVQVELFLKANDELKKIDPNLVEEISDIEEGVSEKK